MKKNVLKVFSILVAFIGLVSARTGIYSIGSVDYVIDARTLSYLDGRPWFSLNIFSLDINYLSRKTQFKTLAPNYFYNHPDIDTILDDKSGYRDEYSSHSAWGEVMVGMGVSINTYFSMNFDFEALKYDIGYSSGGFPLLYSLSVGNLLTGLKFSYPLKDRGAVGFYLFGWIPTSPPRDYENDYYKSLSDDYWTAQGGLFRRFRPSKGLDGGFLLLGGFKPGEEVPLWMNLNLGYIYRSETPGQLSVRFSTDIKLKTVNPYLDFVYEPFVGTGGGKYKNIGDVPAKIGAGIRFSSDKAVFGIGFKGSVTSRTKDMNYRKYAVEDLIWLPPWTPSFELSMYLGYATPLVPGFPRVKGFVVDAVTKTPLKDVMVKIPGWDSVKTDEKGKYELKGPKIPGAYKVVFTKKFYQTITRPVELEPGKVIKMNVEMKKIIGILSGVVRDKETGNPIKATIKFPGYEGKIKPVETDPQTGEFYIELKEGIYTLEFTAPKYSKVVKQFTIKGGDSLVGLVIDMEQNVGIITARLSSIKSDSAVPDVEVVVYDIKGKEVATTKSDVKGEFRIELPAGEYTFEFKKEGFYPRKLKVVVEKQKVKELNVKLLPRKVQFTLHIPFRRRSSRIPPQYYPQLDKIAKILKEYPNIKIIVEGHTSLRGSRRYNKRLSIRRANAVRNYLISKGIDPTRIIAVGYGEERPLVYPERTRADRAKNRRVVIRTAD